MLTLLGGAVFKSTQETQESFYKEGRVDTPYHAGIFLKRLAAQNMPKLKELDVAILV